MRLYLSGPLTAPDAADTMRNLSTAYKIANELIRAGHIVYVPHLAWHLDIQDNGNFGYEFWLDYDLQMLKELPWDGLVRAPGKSNGSDLEVDTALAHHIPIWYWDKPEHQAYLLANAAPEFGEILAGWSGAERS